MNETKRRVIEEEYICEGIIPLEEKMSEARKELGAYAYYERTLVHNTHKLKHYGKIDKRDSNIYWYGDNNIKGGLELAVSQCRQNLTEASRKANVAFNTYMGLKNDIKEGKAFYKNDETRRAYSFLKKNWIEASNDVLRCKSALRQIELKYSRFLEWYDATNRYIKYLENQIEQYKEGKGETPTGVRLW